MNERLLAVFLLMLFLGTHAYSQDSNEKSSGSPSTGASVPDGGRLLLGGSKQLTATSSRSTKQIPVAELRDKFEEWEQHSREIAAKLRGSLKDSSEADALRNMLRESVKHAFAARQELQRAELDEFAKRLEDLRRSLEQSDRFSEKIIERRVEELLDPNLKWYAPKPLANSAASRVTGLNPPSTTVAKAPAAPNTGAISPQPISPELFSPFELRLAYLESGEDRTEYTVPGAEQKVYVAKQPFASIADIVAARTIDDAAGQPAIEITFLADSAKRLEEVTQQHLNKPLAILMDGKLLSAPTIRDRVGSAAVITGRFSREEAEQIAQKIETAKKAAFGQTVSDVDADPVWGEAVDGLQLAVSGIRQNRHFKSGDTIRFRLHVRNVGTEAIRYQYKTSEMCYWIAPLVEKATGEQVKIRQTFFRGGHNTYSGTLEPMANVPIHVSGIVVLGAPDTGEKSWPSIEKAQPGEYRLRGEYMLQPLDADGNEIIQRDANGMRTVKTSDLTSGTVTFHID
jgi:hypothetical protein